MKAALAALALLLWASPAPAQDAPAPGSVAFFGLRFIDLSTEGAINGARPDEATRTEMATDLVAKDMVARGFTLVPIDPVVDQLQTISNPADCNGCDTAMAAKLGAEYALTGEVRKISNLILSLQLNLRDAGTGKTLRAGTVDIRGNTDESWQRGFSYLLRNLIFRMN
ncbi:DUF3280 domain-containing protein [Tabrizicola aquatica]|uniref:DUF3280 domain-containing protein n=1 Tax=Tabrizicola aquatica TaxID=909926 RepID=UPI000CD0AA8D|nr:DUF3280 domain-containing protein [Tabrizicola aquatica]